MSVLNWFRPRSKRLPLPSQEEIFATVESYIKDHATSDPAGVRKAYVAGMIHGTTLARKCFGVDMYGARLEVPKAVI